MKRKIETTILIDAPIAAVWSVLTDFTSYPVWSPTIQNFDGIPKVGQRTKVLLQQPGGMRITMNPVFLKLETNREIRWKGRLWIDGIFDGEHCFIVEPVANGQTRLIQGELFSGILIPFLKKMIDVDTKNGFVLFNAALKAEVEGRY